MSNVDTARSAYQAFRSGGLAALAGFYTDDAVCSVWYSCDEVLSDGQVQEPDGIIDDFSRRPRHWTMSGIEPSDYIDYGECVVVVGTQHFADGNSAEDSTFVNVLRFDEDGKIVSDEFYADRTELLLLQS